MKIILPQTTNHKPQANKGFTLIEILLYLVIVAMIVGIIASFFFLMYEMQIKSTVVAEVEEQGDLAMENILRTIRGSKAITLPGVGITTSSVTLDVTDVAKDPTLIDSVGGRIRIAEGASSPVYLTGDKLNVSSINFSNISYIDTPGTVRVEFKINYINNSGRNEYDYERTFYGTATLR